MWKRLYWRSSTLASRFPTKFDRHDVKRGFLFFMQVPALLQKRKQAPRIVMNELPVIGSLRLRKEFWDRQRENIVTRYKGTYGERFYWRPKKRFFARDYDFFAAVLLYVDKDILIRGKCKFLLELPRNVSWKISKNFSPCVRSCLVKSSSRNGLEILRS